MRIVAGVGKCSTEEEDCQSGRLWVLIKRRQLYRWLHDLVEKHEQDYRGNNVPIPLQPSY